MTLLYLERKQWILKHVSNTMTQCPFDLAVVRILILCRQILVKGSSEIFGEGFSMMIWNHDFCQSTRMFVICMNIEHKCVMKYQSMKVDNSDQCSETFSIQDKNNYIIQFFFLIADETCQGEITLLK